MITAIELMKLNSLCVQPCMNAQHSAFRLQLSGYWPLSAAFPISAGQKHDMLTSECKAPCKDGRLSNLGLWPWRNAALASLSPKAARGDAM